MKFVIRILVNTVALWVAVRLVSGLSYDGGWPTLLFVGLVFGVLNAIVRPILSILSIPLILVTLGLFIFVLNAFMLWMTGALSSALGLGFHVDGFWAAFWGGLVVSIVSTLISVAARD